MIKLCSADSSDTTSLHPSHGVHQGLTYPGSCNPHGIDTILSRQQQRSAAVVAASVPDTQRSPPPPPPQSYFNAHQLSQLTAAACQAAAAATTPNPGGGGGSGGGSGGGGGKLEDHLAAAAVAGRASMYWPGLQGLMSNPNIWRDRLALNSKFFHTNIFIPFGKNLNGPKNQSYGSFWA